MNNVHGSNESIDPSAESDYCRLRMKRLNEKGKSTSRATWYPFPLHIGLANLSSSNAQTCYHWIYPRLTERVDHRVRAV